MSGDMSIPNGLSIGINSVSSNSEASLTVNANKTNNQNSTPLDFLSITQTTSLDTSLNASSNNPQLPSPIIELGSFSLLEFFSSIGITKLNFNRQMNESDYVDQLTRNKVATGQDTTQSDLAAVIAESNAKMVVNQANFEDFSDTFDELGERAPQETADMQDLISQTNNSDAVKNEQIRAQQLSQAYTTYINEIKKLPGVVDLGGGRFYIPPPSKDYPNTATMYNILTNQYNTAVNNFNNNNRDYITALNNYNSTVDSYNQQVDADNENIANIINNPDYDFAVAIADGTFPNLQRQSASTYDTSSYNFTVATGPLSGGGAVTITAPPSAVQTIANKNATLTQLNNYPDFRSDTFDDQLNTIVNVQPQQEYVDYINSIITSIIHLNNMAVFSPPQDTIPDPFLNEKKIMRKIIPNSFINPAVPAALNSGSGVLMGATLSSATPHVLGKSEFALFKKTFKDLNISLANEQIDQIAEQLQSLSASLLQKNSTQAAVFGIGPYGTLLDSDSPSLAIFHSLALLNLVQNSLGQPFTQKIVNNFIKTIPALANLSQDQLTRLTASITATINLNQLVTAVKMFGDSLGLPKLLAQFLPTLNLNLDPNASSPLLSNGDTTENFPTSPNLTSSTPDTNLDSVSDLTSTATATNTPNISSTVTDPSINLGTSANNIPTNSTAPFPSNSTNPPNANDFSTQNNQNNIATNNYSKESIANLNQNKLNNGVPSNVSENYPDFSNQVTPTLTNLNANNFTVLFNQAQEDATQALQNLTTNLSNFLNSQGIKETESKFLAQFATDVIDRGVNTPSPVRVSSNTVDTDLLADSITASLLLQSYDLNTAQQTANDVINQTLENNYKSPTIFRSALTANLEEAGLGNQAVDIAADAVIVPKQSTSDLAQTSLPPNDLLNLINQRINSLLDPQFNKENIQTIKQQVFTTLYGLPNPDFSDPTSVQNPRAVPHLINNQLSVITGTVNPDSSDIADVKAPTSVTNTERRQIKNNIELTRVVEQNHEYAELTIDLFREYINNTPQNSTTTANYANPAYAFLYASGTGITHQGNDPKNARASIDIQV